MTSEPILTVVGNLTADPELRFTPSGAAVASFTIAATPRTYDKQSNEWKDGEALFMRCNVWRQQAENVAESLTRGMRVIATGKLKANTYETREGEKRTTMQLDVEEVGPALKYASAKVNRTERGSNSGPASQQSVADDPWGSAPAAGGGFSDEPPFFHRTALPEV